MDMQNLKRPKKAAKGKAAAKPDAAPAETGPAKVVDLPSSNLARQPSGANKPKQFKLPPEIIQEFEVRAREEGYRRDSEFFQHVWEVYKAARG